MNSLDRFMEFVVAAVFTLVGLSKIFSYKYKAARADGAASELAVEFPYWCVALVGLFEMFAAIALAAPIESKLFAAVALGLSTLIAGLYRASVQKPAAPTVVLLLLVLFVICARVL